MPEMPQDPVNGCQHAAALEPVALVAWPARECIVLDGWVLRFTDGFTHRGNSVATFAFTGDDLESAIAIVEREYRARNLPPMFQVAAHGEPPTLSDALIARGYQTISPTFVRATTPSRALSHLPTAGEVAVSKKPVGAFAKLVLTGSRTGNESEERLAILEGDGHERLDILARISVPLVCVTAFDNGKAVSCGMGVGVDGKVGVNLMRTDALHRRRGHAQRVLSAIAHWAGEQRADMLYLGVEMANTPAVTLYDRAGFEPAYSYRYYAKGRHS